MDIIRLPSFTRLAILSVLLAPSFAQNNTTIHNADSCRVDFDANAPINGTGNLNIHWNALMMDPVQNDWTLSLTYNETRNHNGTVHRWDSYISVPRVSEAKACIFMFAGLDKTSSSSHRHGCDGIIDETCTSALQEIDHLGEDCTWPTPFNEFADKLRQSCGANILNTGPQTYRKCSQSCLGS